MLCICAALDTGPRPLVKSRRRLFLGLAKALVEGKGREGKEAQRQKAGRPENAGVLRVSVESQVLPRAALTGVQVPFIPHTGLAKRQVVAVRAWFSHCPILGSTFVDRAT